MSLFRHFRTQTARLLPAESEILKIVAENQPTHSGSLQILSNPRSIEQFQHPFAISGVVPAG
jgi:hypothetical protein